MNGLWLLGLVMVVGGAFAVVYLVLHPEAFTDDEPQHRG